MEGDLLKQDFKLTTQEIIQRLDELIAEGINMGKEAEPELLTRIAIKIRPNAQPTFKLEAKENAIHNLYEKELFWYENVKKFWLEELYELSDIRALYKSHRIIPPLGGLEYRDPESEKSREILDKIRNNTNNVTDLLLKDLMPKLKNIKQGGNTNKTSEEEYKKIIQNKQKNEKLKKIEKIKQITIIEWDDGKHSVGVNGDDRNIRDIRKNSKYWRIFIKEVKDQYLSFEERSGLESISNFMKTYFNSNSKCLIYMKGKYALTEVIKGEGEDAEINPNITLEILTEEKYLARKKRKMKK